MVAVAFVITIIAYAILNANGMQYTNLGSSAIKVSKVCLGTMTFGEQNTQEEAASQLDIAFKEYNVNFLDTAEMYPIPTKAETQGLTDKYIASWMKSSGLSRDKIVLATKVAGPGITWLPGRNGQNSRVREKDIIASVDASLERLGTDYIDLLQIHWPDRYVPIFGATLYNMSMERDATPFEEQIVTLNKLIQAGKVREIGLSNETPYGIMRFSAIAKAMNLKPFVSLQNSYSLINRCEYDSGVSEVCSPRNENIALLAYSPLAGGILSGKYADQKVDNSKSRLNLFPGYMARYKQSLAVAAVERYAEYAKSIGLTTTELALGWCYKRETVASSIIGATTDKQLRENLNAFDEAKWSKIDDSKIDEIHTLCKDPSKI